MASFNNDAPPAVSLSGGFSNSAPTGVGLSGAYSDSSPTPVTLDGAASYTPPPTTPPYTTGGIMYAVNGTDLAVAAGLVWNGSARLGIGTASPQGTIHLAADDSYAVYQSQVGAANFFAGPVFLGATTGFTLTTRHLGILRAGTHGGSNSTAVAELIFDNLSNVGSTSATSYGVFAIARTSAGATFNGSIGQTGLYGEANHGGSGTMTGSIAVRAALVKSGTGTVSTGYAFYASLGNTNASGAITTGYGLYIAAPTLTGAITNEWGVYVASTTAKNYFAGRVEHGKEVYLAAIAAPGSPVTGDIWNDSTRQCVRAYLGGHPQSLSATIYTQTASYTLSNSAVETSMIYTGIGSLALPGNFWAPGKTARIRIYGTWGFYPSNSITFRIKLGSTVIATVATYNPGTSFSGRGFVLEGSITCRAIGASGSFFGQMTFRTVQDASAGYVQAYEAHSCTSAAVTVDTTAANTLSVTAQFASANASANWTSTNAAVEILN